MEAKMARKPVLVTSLSEAQQNIREYQKELSANQALRDRAGYVRAWYLDKNTTGEWLFAPSKFTGYRFASARDYLLQSGNTGQRDGRETERMLAEWYEVVDPDTRLGRELSAALRKFLAAIGQAPNKLARINRPKGGWETDATDNRAPLADRDALLSRISANPDICGGRPTIRGTRMRVADIVEMMAHGATRAEIVADFDYLADEDIAAALLYAAQATGHRTIRAA
jgi:uncharacterized protein (DUF433 family)